MSQANPPYVEIRRLWPADMEAFRDHLLRLDTRSRHHRFGGGMSDEFIAQYAKRCFGEGDLVFGAFVGGRMCGAAELRSNRAIWREQAPFGRHIHAEAAFSVERDYSRQGIGEKLFRRLLRAATNHGVETIEIVCLPDNTAMQNLAKKFHTRFAFEGDALTGRLIARRATPLSLMREAATDAMDFGESVWDAQLRALQEPQKSE